MEALCVSILAGILHPAANDNIHDCHRHEPALINIGDVADEPRKLFDFSDDKIHTFPYKDVLPCWFRLYTDTSIVRAIAKIRDLQAKQAQQTTRKHDEELRLLDDAIDILDMALIMAGGAGRKSEIQDLFRSLPALLRIAEEHKDANLDAESEESNPRKRLKVLRGASSNTADQDEDELFLTTYSLPYIKNGVPRITQPSMKQFHRHMHEQKSPIIITDGMDHWKGLQSWRKKSYWLGQTLGGRRRTPIEVGRSYTDDNWGQKIVPFRYFLEKYICPKETSTEDEDTSTAPPFPENDDRGTGYLAQHDLFEQIPSLYGAIATPEYCFWDPPLAEDGTPVALSKKRHDHHQLKTSHPSTIPIASMSPKFQGITGNGLICSQVADKTADVEPPEIQRNIWFGPPWTISPLHHDPYHNILCQVVGKKYFRLYSPAYSENLHPRSTDEETPHAYAEGEAASIDMSNTSTIDMSNTSTIDIAAMELSPAEDWDDRYPGISKVPYLECVLEAGEMLYIPVGWWHYVRSCSVGISVSFWWGG